MNRELEASSMWPRNPIAPTRRLVTLPDRRSLPTKLTTIVTRLTLHLPALHRPPPPPLRVKRVERPSSSAGCRLVVRLEWPLQADQRRQVVLARTVMTAVLIGSAASMATWSQRRRIKKAILYVNLGSRQCRRKNRTISNLRRGGRRGAWPWAQRHPDPLDLLKRDFFCASASFHNVCLRDASCVLSVTHEN